MLREISMITKKDMEWYKLNQQVRKIIITKKDWLAFKRYMDVYWKK